MSLVLREDLLKSPNIPPGYEARDMQGSTYSTCLRVYESRVTRRSTSTIVVTGYEPRFMGGSTRSTNIPTG